MTMEKKSIPNNSDNQSYYPCLLMDSHEIFSGNKAWEGIEINKGSYSKEELSQLFGVDAGIIKTVEAYKKGEADFEMYGSRVERGLIIIETTRGDNVNE